MRILILLILSTALPVAAFPTKVAKQILKKANEAKQRTSGYEVIRKAKKAWADEVISKAKKAYTAERKAKR